jgi:ABC-type uncharacterized transport system permease subunit
MVDLIEALLCIEIVIGVVAGLVAAGLVHWLMPVPEPVLLEALLVFAGFVGGLVWVMVPSRLRQKGAHDNRA